ncbi:uncharacterized protein PV09_09277 [Verruconis gallopava]|uniref:Uncharacterized protein n=1 Tax=Verruconis gallopava TaxID=253628 RepID=A0A0D1ZX47_9PEZI|nr:uncharacterized protein PV09_09277 [Verruconis gallopava]KIV98997.1 hypothetical protein PV09_09277 [Verruconis gallopava]
MRAFAPKSLVRATPLLPERRVLARAPSWPESSPGLRRRLLVKVGTNKEPGLKDAWFSRTGPLGSPPGEEGQDNCLDYKKNDERTVKLGKTIRILQERLPSLLITPLPQEILSPQITLRLFPSTHPHLPTVTGKIAYTAALWTSPVAWGRVPVLGNVKLIILSERMVKTGCGPTATAGQEKLIVRWKTCPKGKANGVVSSIDKIAEWVGGDDGRAVDKDKEFHGIFMFEFDEEGRILTHVIEHAEEGGLWDRTTKVISVTDWLLGRAWGKKEEEQPGLALGCLEGGTRRDRR